MGGAGKDYIFGSGGTDETDYTGCGPSSLATNGDLTYRSCLSETLQPPPVAEGPEIARGVSWVIYNKAGTDANGFENFIIKGAYPYTDDTDKGNVIDAGAGDDWVSAGWANDSVHGGDNNGVTHGLAGNDVIFGDAEEDKLFGDGTTTHGYYTTVHGEDVVIESAGAGTDLVLSSASFTLGANLENLTLTGAGAVNATGNAAANVKNLTLTGATAINATGNTLTNVLAGNTGANRIDGGTGHDTCVIGRGYGAELLQENDATAGNTDVMQFLSGVASDQIWFRKVSIIGTTDKVLVQNWYLGSQYHVEQFKTSDGKTLLDSKVQDWVSAMASFALPTVGQTTLPSNYQASLLPIIAADWGP